MLPQYLLVMSQKLTWTRKVMRVRDMAGFTTDYVCLPKPWAKSNLNKSREVEITLLSDGSLRVAPVEDVK